MSADWPGTEKVDEALYAWTVSAVRSCSLTRLVGTGQGQETLRSLRDRAGLTREQVAEALDTSSPSVIFRWETGRSLPRIHYLRPLAALYGVDVDTILTSLGL
jgi:DNA-binding XRE family transcriptional regulator